jgi:hypothetical protein
MPNLPIPSRPGVLATIHQDRQLAKRAAGLERRAMEVRAEDVARRYVAAGRMNDIKGLTSDALEAAGEIADVLACEVQAKPFFARELSEIASTGARGLKTELAYYVEEGH